ncbi:32 kDa beta-galactoside-binding lectin-like [Chironomus tepperi]|uniref:32 kDa beta-galactoside-binding lectin-like n=1 Tax=Chironomus tepperi TaxID=113505 RepID=UPI00391F0C73
MYNFVEILSDFVKIGQSFEICGTTLPEAEKFSISFTNGTASDAEKVLNIDVDFSNNKVIINKELENDVSLESGSKFEFQILVDNDNFDINLNGSNLCEYKWQTAPDMIRAVIINGDVASLTKMNHLSEDYPKIAENEDILGFESFTPIKYQPGHVISISGHCTEEFYLTFLENNTNRQMIHFDVRFEENTVVMNTEDDVDCWTETEDRSEAFPFEVEKPFKIAFAFTSDLLKIAVNGTKLMDFSLERILLNEDQCLWDVLSGFRIVNREEETVTAITNVEHIQMDSACDDFEQYCTLE